MTDTVPGSVANVEDEDEQLQRRIDKWLIGGTVVCCTCVLGVFGLPIIAVGLLKTRRAIRDGRSLRPITITIIGLTALFDAGINFISLPMDLIAHDTLVGQTFITGLGRIFDSGYLLDYNSTSLGGTPLTSEKSWQIAGALVMYPMRVVAAIGFLQMKRWGYQQLIVTSYMYVFFWIGYSAQFVLDFPFRYGYSQTGLIGFWIVNLMYATAFLVLPYLHTVNREQWSE